MRTPAFWYPAAGKPAGLLPWLLSPFACLFSFGGLLRARINRPYHAPAPVICIGNLAAGGAGKTPAVLAIARRLLAQGVNVHCLTRGYGGSLRGPVRVDPASHTATDVGDEPLLLAAVAPTWVSRDRKLGAMVAVAAGAELLLLDDGHQNPHIAKDVSLVLVDAARGFGNGWVLPAGPLREPAARGLARATAVLLVGGASPAVEKVLAERGIPLLLGHKAACGGSQLTGQRLLAFCGIGAPEQFLSMLRELGADLAATRIFPDHHPFTDKAISALLSEAKNIGAGLITTEKDLMRMPLALRPQVRALAIEMRFADEAALMHILSPALQRLKAHGI